MRDFAVADFPLAGNVWRVSCAVDGKESLTAV